MTSSRPMSFSTAAALLALGPALLQAPMSALAAAREERERRQLAEIEHYYSRHVLEENAREVSHLGEATATISSGENAQEENLHRDTSSNSFSTEANDPDDESQPSKLVEHYYLPYFRTNP